MRRPDLCRDPHASHVAHPPRFVKICVLPYASSEMGHSSIEGPGPEVIGALSTFHFKWDFFFTPLTQLFSAQTNSKGTCPGPDAVRKRWQFTLTIIMTCKERRVANLQGPF